MLFNEVLLFFYLYLFCFQFTLPPLLLLPTFTLPNLYLLLREGKASHGESMRSVTSPSWGWTKAYTAVSRLCKVCLHWDCAPKIQFMHRNRSYSYCHWPTITAHATPRSTAFRGPWSVLSRFPSCLCGDSGLLLAQVCYFCDFLPSWFDSFAHISIPPFLSLVSRSLGQWLIVELCGFLLIHNGSLRHSISLLLSCPVLPHNWPRHVLLLSPLPSSPLTFYHAPNLLRRSSLCPFLGRSTYVPSGSSLLPSFSGVVDCRLVGFYLISNIHLWVNMPY